ncbi:MAG: RecQ family ATP-dependent DNA helicase [Ignavibacteriae bacterium]|nr:RecQ family ATP-dependent DNA helicase [Ignavibacteriota bacterium]
MLLKKLHEFFGFENFRPGQEQIIKDILDKKNVLVIMPTGAGKSICYQLPSIISETYSIIISPLISLMQDQVNSLNQKQKIAAFINSSLDFSESEKVLNELQNSKIKLLFVSPEKLNNINFVQRIKNLKPEFLFIDEAHCISEWGHNFRPSYRNIKNFTQAIEVKNISAFTATATPEVRKDIIEQLQFENPSVHITGFERENISLNVLFDKNKKEKIAEILRGNKTTAIIYSSTRKHAEQLSQFLNLQKITNEFYHAGLTNELRRIIQDNFINGRTNIIVATNAFGMGIDKKNIGLVIHYNIPSSIENLYQEFGRAGRDGSESKAILFYSNRDKEIQEFFIQISNPNVEQIKKCYDAILDFYKIAVNSKTEKLLEISNDLIKLIESKEIHKGLIPSIISILEESNYLKLHSQNSLCHFIQIKLSQNDLKKYLKGMFNSELQDFVIQLIKIFGNSIFNSKVEINFDFLYQNFGYSKRTINEFLFTLNNIGIIEYDKPAFVQKISMLTERVASKNLKLNKAEINKKIQLAENKLDQVLEYVNTDDCRFKFILEYFGEETKNYKCGKCDNCSNKNKNINNNEFINEIIIRTFKEFKGSLTENRLIGILKGSSNSNIARKISTFENCKHYSIQEIESSIQFLLKKNILKEINDELVFNPLEELFFVEENEFENVEVQDNHYEINLELYNKLREERDLAAKKFNQNPQIICSDKILREIVKDKPQSSSAILQISGFNQRMFNKIGPEFLSIIKEHTTIENENSIAKKLPKHISQTYDLILKKYSLYDISKLLKLPESIVSIQVETIISYYPNLDFSSLISKEEFDLVKANIMDFNEDLKSIKSRIETNVSYSKIRIVKAILKANSSSV